MKILCLDLGEKRIGVARSDEMGMFAHGIGFISRDAVSDAVIFTEIEKYIAEFGSEKVVVGVPINMDGTDGIAAGKVREFAALLAAALPVPIVLWDERLSSKEAMRYMQNSNMSGSKKRQKVDSLAAQIILQNYLDCNR
jgi:putative Holliday junction resolvase